MSTAHIDRVDTLQCVEKGGVVRSLTRRARVTDLEDTDFTVLWTALEDAGIPKVPSPALDEFGEVPAGFEFLLLADREATLVGEDPGTVDVTLVYNHVLDGDNQELTVTDEEPINQDFGVIYAKTRCSVQQKTTNLRPLWDYPGAPLAEITVEHTFPSDDPQFPNRLVVQGGEFTASVPQQNVQFGGFINTDVPKVIAKSLIATINKYPWNGEAELQWMCMEVAWQRVGIAADNFTGRYRFDFEFQHNPDTWDPYVVFIDQRTGRPPPGLVENVGYKHVPYHKRISFSDVFAALIDGWQEWD